MRTNVDIDDELMKKARQRSKDEKGIAVRKTVDRLIATFCIAEGHSLLHRDRDFDPFEEHLGLSVVHPQNH